MPPVQKTCFIAMPITTSAADAERYDDADHWEHVMRSLFMPSIAKAGFAPIPPIAEGSHMIHSEIIKHLVHADLVLCDLSAHNPNVFFELGVRTALNKPIALVRDEHTTLPFDTSGVNTAAYKSELRGWLMDSEIEALADHLTKSATSCAGENPLWRKFGLTLVAEAPRANETPMEAKIDLLMSRFDQMSHTVAAMRHEQTDSRPPSLSRNMPIGKRVPRREVDRAVSGALHSDASERVVAFVHDAVSDGLISPDDFEVVDSFHVALSLDGPISDFRLRQLSNLADSYGVQLSARNLKRKQGGTWLGWKAGSPDNSAPDDPTGGSDEA